MSQRRLDLAVCEGYELRQMLSRFQMLKRMAQEMGANPGVIAQWSMHIKDVQDELEMREAPASEEPPF